MLFSSVIDNHYYINYETSATELQRCLDTYVFLNYNLCKSKQKLLLIKYKLEN